MSDYSQDTLPKSIAAHCLKQPEPLPAAAHLAVKAEHGGGDSYFTFEDHSLLGFNRDGKPFHLKVEYDFDVTRESGYGGVGESWVRPSMGRKDKAIGVDTDIATPGKPTPGAEAIANRIMDTLPPWRGPRDQPMIAWRFSPNGQEFRDRIARAIDGARDLEPVEQQPDLSAQQWADLDDATFARKIMHLGLDLAGHPIETQVAITAVLTDAADRIERLIRKAA